MKTIEINVQEPYWSFIASGQKTVEGRLNKGKFLDLRTGDHLKINGWAEFEIVGVNVYKNFREMILAEGISNVIPDKDTVDEAVKVYYKFYTPEDEQTFGVSAIRIKRIY